MVMTEPMMLTAVTDLAVLVELMVMIEPEMLADAVTD